jgi:dTDP-4-dehydrorhamnose 3,5-epimerase
VSRFVAVNTSLASLKVICRTSIADSRGSFSRLFCQEELAVAGWWKPIAQINHSSTAHRGTIRGLHFQRPPNAEMKLVSCIRGMAWDVAVDVRAGSPTFLQWHAELLSADNGRSLLIPEGFAHGFQTLTDHVELVYCHSAPYTPQAETGLWPFDSMVSVSWPLAATEISDRDASFPRIGREFQGVLL